MPEIKIDLLQKNIQPKSNELEPTLLIPLSVEHEKVGLVFFDFAGQLLLDNKKLCRLEMVIPSFLDRNHTDYSLRALDNDNRSCTSFRVELEALLSTRVLEYIENERVKNIKGDLQLKVIIEGRYYKAKFRIKEIGKLHHSQGGQHPAIVLDNKNAIMSLQTYNLHESFIIPQSSWIHDFLPAFGMGQHIVYEIPKPDLNVLKGEMKKRMEQAFISLAAMEKAKNLGEWKEVIEKARPLLELARKKTMVEQTLKNAGFTPEAIINFNEMLMAAFNYSSKFIHKVAKGGTIMADIPAQKEDAIFIYSIAINILNTLIKKVHRKPSVK